MAKKLTNRLKGLPSNFDFLLTNIEYSHNSFWNFVTSQNSNICVTYHKSSLVKIGVWVVRVIKGWDYLLKVNG